jgi:hypothetical protein
VKPAPSTQKSKQGASTSAAPTNVAAPTSHPAGPAQLPLRQWTDNSGTFKVTARLILVLDGSVRLLKETGRTTTVPFARLSAADRQYVTEIVARFGKDLTNLDQLAAR